MRTLTFAAVLLTAATVSAQTRSVYIEDLTWFEIRDAMAAGKTAAIIYAGGTEQNGPHMSLVKHNLIAHHVAGQIAEKLGNALGTAVSHYNSGYKELGKVEKDVYRIAKEKMELEVELLDKPNRGEEE